MNWNRFNLARLESQIEYLSTIGETKQGGTTRLGFTPEDMEGKNYVKKLMQEAGMETYYDPAGNLIGTYFGWDPDSPGIIMGSHLDTVPEGGKYDGIAGVLTAIEIIRSLYDSEIRPGCNIIVIAFADEEGVRFGGSLFGSRSIIGALSPDWLDRRDSQGITMFNALQECGFQPELIESAKLNPKKFQAYFELHLEQGKVLEAAGLPLGVVTGISAPVQLWITVIGKPDHAGATPMLERKDALTAAAELVLAIERICTPKPGHISVGTVGSLSVKPNALNVIPGQVEFSVDVRDIDVHYRSQLIQQIKDYCQHVSQKRGVEIMVQDTLTVDPVSLDSGLIDLLVQTCDQLQIPYQTIISGAGHDAMLMARIMPTAMIFLRCREGVSHNPDEFVSGEDLYLGARLLSATILKLAETD